jgi:hypothetical protein
MRNGLGVVCIDLRLKKRTSVGAEVFIDIWRQLSRFKQTELEMIINVGHGPLGDSALRQVSDCSGPSNGYLVEVITGRMWPKV